MVSVSAKKSLALTDTTVGKKAALAVSGVVLFGFVIGHMAGNLQIFLGREVFNHYAATLKGNFALLWGTRAVVFVAMVVHVALVLELYRKTLAARPVAYRVKKNIATSYAASAMKYSGPAILLYLLFHLAHFTVPGLSIGPYEFSHTDAYGNFVSGFSVPWLTAVYVTANLLLGLHLYHGAFSMLQSVGLEHPRYDRRLRAVSRTFAFLVTAGNVVMPLAVLFGVVK
jgi:succinate dehydrogenase / fumarate reductase cytochrome b subunit